MEIVVDAFVKFYFVGPFYKSNSFSLGSFVDARGIDAIHFDYTFLYMEKGKWPSQKVTKMPFMNFKSPTP